MSGAPFALLSRLDCSDEENVRDALSQLRNCVTNADYAHWACAWGENLCLAAEEHVGCEDTNAQELKDAEAAAEAAEDERDKLSSAVQAHIRAMDTIMEGADPALVDRVNEEIAKLESEL